MHGRLVVGGSGEEVEIGRIGKVNGSLAAQQDETGALSCAADEEEARNCKKSERVRMIFLEQELQDGSIPPRRR
jgi:hypothetical protein